MKSSHQNNEKNSNEYAYSAQWQNNQEQDRQQEANQKRSYSDAIKANAGFNNAKKNQGRISLCSLLKGFCFMW